MNTQDNPADDITRGKSLQSLAEPSQWSQGPPFLKQSQEHWPKKPELTQSEGASELKGLPEFTQFNSWCELVKASRGYSTGLPRGGHTGFCTQ